MATHLCEDASLQDRKGWLLAEGDPNYRLKVREDAWITGHGGGENRFAAAAHATRSDALHCSLVVHLGQSSNDIFKELRTWKVRVRKLRHLPRHSCPLKRSFGR